VGSGVAQLADPYRIGLRNVGLSSTQQLGVNAGEIISIRSDLTESGADAYLDTSLDPYAAAKSAFLQRRHAEIRDQEDGVGVDDEMVDTPVDATPAEEAPPAAQ
jgi:phospholipid-binding lipoprotein MlaA